MKNSKKDLPIFFAIVFSIIFLILPLLTMATDKEVSFDSSIIGEVPQNVEDNFILEPEGYLVETWVDNLRIPWELVFLSDNKALVTERAGQLRLIENGILQEKPYKIITEVEHIGEGGLMGMAKHPDYPQQKYLFIMILTLLWNWIES